MWCPEALYIFLEGEVGTSQYPPCTYDSTLHTFCSHTHLCMTVRSPPRNKTPFSLSSHPPLAALSSPPFHFPAVFFSSAFSSASSHLPENSSLAFESCAYDWNGIPQDAAFYLCSNVKCNACIFQQPYCDIEHHGHPQSYTILQAVEHELDNQ